jgi:hypothetical protein
MAAANSSGGMLGKMIGLQTIAPLRVQQVFLHWSRGSSFALPYGTA